MRLCFREQVNGVTVVASAVAGGIGEKKERGGVVHVKRKGRIVVRGQIRSVRDMARKTQLAWSFGFCGFRLNLNLN